MSTKSKKRSRGLCAREKTSHVKITYTQISMSWEIARSYLCEENGVLLVGNRNITVMTSIGVPISFHLELCNHTKTLSWTILDTQVYECVYSYSYFSNHEYTTKFLNEFFVHEIYVDKKSSGIKMECLNCETLSNNTIILCFADVISAYLSSLREIIDKSWKLCQSCGWLTCGSFCPDCDEIINYPTQTLYVNERFSIVFGFYSHQMCGHYMKTVYLSDEKNSSNIQLRQDGPSDDGRPCFFDSEILSMLEFILKNPKNQHMTFEQIIRLMATIHYFQLSSLIPFLRNQGFMLTNTPLCFQNDVENIHYTFPIFSETREASQNVLTKDHFYKENIECCYDSDADLDIIIDPYLAGELNCVRSVNGPWNISDRKSIGDFITFLLPPHAFSTHNINKNQQKKKPQTKKRIRFLFFIKKKLDQKRTQEAMEGILNSDNNSVRCNKHPDFNAKIGISPASTRSWYHLLN
jgi:hypothetical protein